MIHHVTREIPPPSLAECVRFYAILGFVRVPEPSSVAGRAVWLSRHGTQIHLVPSDRAQPQLGHVGVLVDGYEATVAQLRDAGHEVQPRREHWGSPRAYVRDPAGHTVEVMAAPPPDSTSADG